MVIKMPDDKSSEVFEIPGNDVLVRHEDGTWEYLKDITQFKASGV